MGIRIARLICGVGALAIFIALAISKKPWDAAVLPGPESKLGEYVAWYGWWAGLVNGCLLAALALTAGCWAGVTRTNGRWLPTMPTPKFFWPVVALAVLLLAGFALPRMGQSLWDDEENSVRRLIAGKMIPEKSGELKLHAANWEKALWSYKRPTNHHLQTWLSKICHETWRKWGPHQPPHFREWVARMPAFLAGLLSLIVLATLLKRLGFAKAGMIAALLFAIHPWFIRYTSEARGYSLTVLFSLLALRCALEGIESGKWKWWAGYGGALFGMLASFPFTVVVAGVLSLLVALALILRYGKSDFLSPAARWFVASLVAAMGFLQLMLPCAPQVDTHVHGSLVDAMNQRWQKNLGALFLAGMPWNNSDDKAADYPELKWEAERMGAIFWFGLWAIILISVLGLFRLVLSKPAGWIPAITWLTTPLLLFLAGKTINMYLYEWYFLFALPWAVATLAIGLETAASWLSRFGKPTGFALFACAFLAALGFQHRARHRLVSEPLEALREAALTMRGSLNPAESNKVLTAQACVRLELYDPRIQHLETAKELVTLAREADRRNLPLFVTYGNPWALSHSSPELASLLNNSRFFEKAKYFRGFDPTLDQNVLRYRSGSLATSPTFGNQ